MPHVDELLGPATLAAAGLFAAIALQPAAPAASPAAVIDDRAPQATVALPPVEVVARRSATLATDDRRSAKKPHA
jgi:hypothetical protein